MGDKSQREGCKMTVGRNEKREEEKGIKGSMEKEWGKLRKRERKVAEEEKRSKMEER